MQKRALAVAAAAVLFCPAPLLLAGEPAWALASISVLAFTMAAWAIWLHRTPVGLLESDFAMAGALVWTIAQLVPLPRSWAPSTVTDGLSLADVEGAVPISIDPGGTREAVVVAAMALAAYILGRISSQVAGRKALLYTVAGAIAVLAAVSFGHEVLDAHRVFGVYEPVDASPSLMSPVLNSNHLGGLLAFGAILWMGLALSATTRPRVFGDSTMGILCAFGTLGSGSRGAVVGLLIGFGIALLVVARRRRAGRGVKRGLWALGIAGFMVCIATASGAGERLWDDFAGGDYSKLDLIQGAFAMSGERPLTGVGRGAFEAAFAARGTSDLRFTHPENIAVQWLVEWGWVFTLLVLGAWVRFFRRVSRSEKTYVVVALGACVAFIVHDLFDFALEMAGVLALFSATLGVIAPRSPGRKISVATQFGVVGVAAVAALVSGVGMTERRPVALQEQSVHIDAEGLSEFARQTMMAHPADAIAALAVTHAMARHANPRSMRWVNRTLELAPSWSAPHEIAASLLARRGAYGQALLEAYEAERRRANTTGELVCWLSERLGVQELVRAASSPVADGEDREDRVRFGDLVAECLEGQKREEFESELILQSRAPGALLRRARSRLLAGDAAGAARDLNSIRAEERGQRYRLLRVEVLGETSGPEAALEYLDQHVAAPTSSEEQFRILSTRARLVGATDDAAKLEDALRALRRMGAGDGDAIARAWGVAGAVHRQNRRRGAAREAFTRAHRLNPEEPRYLWALVGLSRQDGLSAQEAGYLRQLCRLGEDRACSGD